MKRLSSLLLAAAILLSVAALPVSAADQNFNDVPDTHWAYSYIQSAAADGVMNGTGEGNFSPSKTLTRAEFIVMMMRAFYPNDIAPKEAELKDKGIEVTWYTAHCALAYDKKLLLNSDCSAVGDSVMKLYRPDSSLYQLADDLSVSSAVTISRVDMAVIASNIMLDKGVPKLSDADTDATLKAIPDIGTVPYGRQVVMAIAYHYGVITGIDAAGTFNPNGTVDRASAATIYCRLRDCIKEHGTQTAEPTPTPTPTPTPNVEPTPTPSKPPVTGGTKAPYATTEDSIVGTVSDKRVTLSLETHKAPVDYWGKHPELNGLVDKDEYNAYVFMALNREWIAKNGIVASTWQNGAWTDGVDTFNYPCFSTKRTHPIPMELPFTDYYVDAVTGGDIYVNRVGDTVEDDIGIYRVYKATTVDEAYNGNLVPVFAKFTPGMSDKDKIVIMVEAICERMEYISDENTNLPGAQSSNYWSSSAPVMRGICDDYAVMFDTICNDAGIPCMICTGNNHAWNLVYADGEWHIVDVTAVDTGGFKPVATEKEYYTINGWDFDHSYDNQKLIIEALYKDVFGK